jgi:hypothetical protein
LHDSLAKLRRRTMTMMMPKERALFDAKADEEA